MAKTALGYSREAGRIDLNEVKVTGAGFPFYLGPLAQLQRALIHFFIDEANKASYVEMQAPYFINEDSARGTGQILTKKI